MRLAEQLDQLEAALRAGWRLPATPHRLIDHSVALALIDQIRLGVPEQVQAAQRLLERRAQVLNDAHAEAEALLAKAHQQAGRRLGEERSIQTAAAKRAAHIQAQAWRTAERIEQQGEQDAAERLRWLRVQLDALAQVLSEQEPAPESVAERGAATLEQADDQRRDQTPRVMLVKDGHRVRPGRSGARCAAR